jgi:hypothetical protein
MRRSTGPAPAVRTLVRFPEGAVGVRLGFDDYVCGEQVVVFWWSLYLEIFRGLLIGQ